MPREKAASFHCRGSATQPLLVMLVSVGALDVEPRFPELSSARRAMKDASPAE